MKKIFERFSRLLKQLRDQRKEDRLWNDWLNLKIRDSFDLLHILILNGHRELKARALTVLLAPDLRNLPFRWDDTDRSLRNYLSMRRLKVELFPQELLHFAGELVYQNIKHVLREQDENLHYALFEYNKLILEFLEILPEDDPLAEQLISQYMINDPVAYLTMDEMSGYNPLRTILCADKIPDKWKYQADKYMRYQIIAEMEGREQPREKWEGALKCYITHIQMSNYDGEEGYSNDLYASQIRFITELPGIEEYDLEPFFSGQVVHILKRIPSDMYETRHKIARLIQRNSLYSIHRGDKQLT